MGLNRELQRILYVEDEADIRRVATMALESLGGLKVFVCSSGAEAIMVAAQNAVDMVLLDVMMPQLDGPTTLQRLRELPSMAVTPAVFMTAKIQSDEIAYLKSLGAVDVIGKPFDALTLADTLRAIWQRIGVATKPNTSADAAASMENSSGSSATNFAARMTQLKQQFERELPQRHRELQQHWARLCVQWQLNEIEALHVGVHNLAGAGSTFGYDAITDSARALDIRLKALLTQRTAPADEIWRELVTLFLALDTDLRRALAALP